jgi:uncharacterized protein (TIGR02145 family)
MKQLLLLILIGFIGFLPSCRKDDNPNKGTFTDSRDNQVYEWIIIGTQTWMAENMNFDATGSMCYANINSHCKTYGRLYDWTTARVSCPTGWHLPSDEEWKVLEKGLGLSDSELDATGIRETGELGVMMKSRVGWFFGKTGNNLSGFNARPAGTYNDTGSFEGQSQLTNFWTSTPDAGTDPEIWIRSLTGETDGVLRITELKSNGNSVRCIKD